MLVNGTSVRRRLGSMISCGGFLERVGFTRMVIGRRAISRRDLATKRSNSSTHKNGRQPFCLTVAFKAPHVQDQWADQFPYDRADPRLVQLYRDATIPDPPLASREFFDAQPRFLRDCENRVRWGLRFVTPSRYQQSVKNYYRLLSGVDREVGRVIGKLSELGLADNTIIVYTSDHGYYLGERGFAGKWFAHDVSIRVPLIISDPRAAPANRGVRVDDFALNIDLAPTILGFAGLGECRTMQGKSLVPLLTARPPDWRDEFFYEHRLDSIPSIPQSEGRADDTVEVHPLDGLE